jgi:TDG/mug DNA glycosylase family protein
MPEATVGRESSCASTSGSRAMPAPPPGHATAAPPPRPTPADLEAARGRAIPDLIEPGLRVLFCGINPGLWSGATGFHFARPGNRFWKVLHLSGFTDRVLAPWEGPALLEAGLGITNVVGRTTASEAELTRDELRTGADRLRVVVEQYQPAWLAVVGIGAYRAGFGAPGAAVGRQTMRLGETGIWVLPNPSGLNASYQLPALVAAFTDLHQAVRAHGPATQA